MDFQHSQLLVRYLREQPGSDIPVTQIGQAAMRRLGNLYTASLPTWIAAGLEAASSGDDEIGGDRWLGIGYGSGDAADIMPFEVATTWRQAAEKINLGEAMGDAARTTYGDYESLHDHARLTAQL